MALLPEPHGLAREPGVHISTFGEGILVTHNQAHSLVELRSKN